MDNHEFIMQRLTTKTIKAIYIDCGTKAKLMKCDLIYHFPLDYVVDIYFRLDDPNRETTAFINSNSTENILKKMISGNNSFLPDSIVHCIQYKNNKLLSMSYLELEYSHYYKSYNFDFFKRLITNQGTSSDLNWKMLINSRILDKNK